MHKVNKLFATFVPMRHIYNVAAIRDKMEDPPRAQRLQRFINKDEFDLLTQEQVTDLIAIFDAEHAKMIQCIVNEVPFRIER